MTDSSALKKALEELNCAVYDPAFAKLFTLDHLLSIAKAEAKFANALRELWPALRQGRVDAPAASPPPPVQRRQKITLTLEDLGL